MGKACEVEEVGGGNTKGMGKAIEVEEVEGGNVKGMGKAIEVEEVEGGNGKEVREHVDDNGGGGKAASEVEEGSNIKVFWKELGVDYYDDDDGFKELDLRFMVRGVAIEDAKLYDPNNLMDKYEKFEYYVVDLNHDKSGQVLVPFCDPLVTTIDAGGTVRIKSKIFTVAYYFTDVDIIPDSVEYMGETLDCLKCIAYVDLKDDKMPRRWKSAAPPIQGYDLGYLSAALGDKIYSFNSAGLDKPLLYDPDEDTWTVVTEPLPPSQYHGCLLSEKIIPDPARHRFLLHLSCYNDIDPGLYAWYPDNHSCSDSDSLSPDRDTRSSESTDSSSETYSPTSPLSPSWECIRPILDVLSWKKRTAVAQGVLFFFSRKFAGLIHALDLDANCWLNVKWRTPQPALSRCRKARSLFYLGNGHLCLALDGRCTTHLGSTIDFYLFHFRRLNRPTLIFSHRLTKSFDAHNLHYSDAFVPLGDIRW